MNGKTKIKKICLYKKKEAVPRKQLLTGFDSLQPQNSGGRNSIFYNLFVTDPFAFRSPDDQDVNTRR